jgi:hypothetical protein
MPAKPHADTRASTSTEARTTSVAGATTTEDGDPTGAHEESRGDEDDAKDQLALDDLHDPNHHEDGGDDP